MTDTLTRTKLDDCLQVEGQAGDAVLLEVNEEGGLYVEVTLGSIELRLEGHLDSPINEWMVGGAGVWIDRRAITDLDFTGMYAAKLQDYPDVKALCEELVQYWRDEENAKTVPTPAQMQALRGIIIGHKAGRASLVFNVFDLPEGYIEVTIPVNGVTPPAGFTCGIAPDGRVSS